jgi:MFS family permease
MLTLGKIAIYFQAIRGATTLESGLMYIPLALSMAISALASGPLTSAIGYNNPALISGCVLMVIGTGLIATFTPDTSPGRWISYQIIYGIGVGLSFQPPFMVIQTVLHDSKIPTALVTLSFAQVSGGVIIQSIAQNIFLNRLAKNLATAVPSMDPNTVLVNGVLNIISAIPKQHRDQALHAYNDAIVDIFFFALGVTCLALVSTLGVEWKSMKGNKGR